MKRIVQCLRRLGLELCDVAGVLVTHSHRDHTAALRTMARRTEMKIFAPRTVAGELRRTVFDIEKQLQVIPVDRPLRWAASG
jgi:glyoxylase-like metal-dependent hydrolase (beta-lactamase superfamily II)